MELLWNAKASTLSTIILWLGILMGFFIVYGWYMRYVDPAQMSFEKISSDMSELGNRINKACGHTNYVSSYNPTTEKGELILNNSMLCVKTERVRKCTLLLCDSNLTYNIDLSKYVYINIAKYYQNGTMAIWGDNVPLNTTYVSPYANRTLTNDTNQSE